MSDYGWSRGDEREGQGEDDTWAAVTNCNENSDVDGLRIVNDGIMKVGEHCKGPNAWLEAHIYLQEIGNLSLFSSLPSLSSHCPLGSRCI